MITSALKTFWQEEDGQDMVEYCLLLAFIALAATTVLSTIKGNIGTIWTNISNQLATAAGTASS